MEGVQGAAMNSFSYLSEVEIASVITYTRQSWGNGEEAKERQIEMQSKRLARV